MGEIVIARKNAKVCTVLPISQKMKRKIVVQNVKRRSTDDCAESIRTFLRVALGTKLPRIIQAMIINSR